MCNGSRLCHPWHHRIGPILPNQSDSPNRLIPPTLICLSSVSHWSMRLLMALYGFWRKDTLFEVPFPRPYACPVSPEVHMWPTSALFWKTSLSVSPSWISDLVKLGHQWQLCCWLADSLTDFLWAILHTVSHLLNGPWPMIRRSNMTPFAPWSPCVAPDVSKTLRMADNKTTECVPSQMPWIFIFWPFGLPSPGADPLLSTSPMDCVTGKSVWTRPSTPNIENSFAKVTATIAFWVSSINPQKKWMKQTQWHDKSLELGTDHSGWYRFSFLLQVHFG